MLLSGNQPLSRLCRWLSELDAARDSFTSADSTCALSFDCYNPSFHVNAAQTRFTRLKYRGWTFCAASDADGYALLKFGGVVKIEGFVKMDEIKVIGATFKKSSSFYSYPCSSHEIYILKVTDLSTECVMYCLDDIESKSMLFPRKHYDVCFPLLHGSDSVWKLKHLELLENAVTVIYAYTIDALLTL